MAFASAIDIARARVTLGIEITALHFWNKPLKSTDYKMQWPADKIERRKVVDLIPYAKNSRIHSEEQIVQIAKSILEWGWTNPVLVDESGMIIAGHGRVMAAQRLGLVDIPVMVASEWSDAQKHAYVIADNQLPHNASWDNALLATEMIALNHAYPVKTHAHYI